MTQPYSDIYNNSISDAVHDAYAWLYILEYVLDEQDIPYEIVQDTFLFHDDHNETIASHMAQLFAQ